MKWVLAVKWNPVENDLIQLVPRPSRERLSLEGLRAFPLIRFQPNIEHTGILARLLAPLDQMGILAKPGQFPGVKKPQIEFRSTDQPPPPLAQLVGNGLHLVQFLGARFRFSVQIVAGKVAGRVLPAEVPEFHGNERGDFFFQGRFILDGIHFKERRSEHLRGRKVTSYPRPTETVRETDGASDLEHHVPH